MGGSGVVVRSVRVRVGGRVQGVGYRAWTRRTALSLGLEGWVRNRRDGSVEAVLQGAPDRVEAMIAACREGPADASVTGIEVLADEAAGAFTGFEIRETA